MRSKEKRTLRSSCVRRSCFSSRSFSSSLANSGASICAVRLLISGMAANASSVSLLKETISACAKRCTTSACVFIWTTTSVERGSCQSTQSTDRMYLRYCVLSMPTDCTSLNSCTSRKSRREMRCASFSRISEACSDWRPRLKEDCSSGRNTQYRHYC